MNKFLLTIIAITLSIGGFFAIKTAAQTTGQNDLARTSPAAAPAGTTAAGTQSDDPARDILFLLNRLSGIQIKTDIFASKAFTSLRDFGLTVTAEPYGRPNPFAPIGTDVSAPATPSGSGSGTGTGATGSGGNSSAPRPTPSPTRAPTTGTGGFDDLNDGFFDEEL